VGTIRTHGQRSRCLTQMRTRAAPARPTPPARRRASQTGTRCHLRRGTPPAPAPRVNIRHPILHQSLQALALSSCQHQRGLCIERFATPARAKGKGGNKRWATHLKDAEGVVSVGMERRGGYPPLFSPNLPTPRIAPHTESTVEAHARKKRQAKTQWRHKQRHKQRRKSKQRSASQTKKRVPQSASQYTAYAVPARTVHGTCGCKTHAHKTKQPNEATRRERTRLNSVPSHDGRSLLPCPPD
jgi:hypothetical protein